MPQVLSTMSLTAPNTLMHTMLGTEGGKDSVCSREFLREKMVNVCQVIRHRHTSSSTVTVTVTVTSAAKVRFIRPWSDSGPILKNAHKLVLFLPEKSA